MDCDEVKVLLDAHALGATEADEAAGLEEHVADCVRCWSALSEAQRAAATLALTTAMQRAPDSLRRSILAQVEQSEGPARSSIMERLRGLLPVGAGALAVAAAAAIAFAAFLQVEVNDLHDDNDRLAADLTTANTRITEQQQLLALLSAPDVVEVSLEPADPTSSAGAVYRWSGSTGDGALLGSNLPPLQPGQVYGVWFLTADGESYSIGSFETWDGFGQLGMELDELPERPVAISVSIDASADVAAPDDIVLTADLD